MGDIETEILLASDKLYDAGVVARIRMICAREFGVDESYPFFWADYRDGETADEALLRLYNQERRAQGITDRTAIDEIAMVLCHG